MIQRPEPFEVPLPLAAEHFRARRERLLERVGDGVVLLRSAPEQYRSRDTEVPYRQDSDFHYLTGFPEPEAAAVLTPHDPEHRFTLFVRPRDPDRERWSGIRVGVDRAREEYGADAAYPIQELMDRLPELLRPAQRVFYSVGQDPALDELVLQQFVRFRRSRPRTGEGPVGVEDLDPLLGKMRRIKEPAEVERIRAAARVTVEGHRRAMALARPGVGEWELQAAVEGTFRGMGADGPAFPTIVGSADNATVLHYVSNQRRTLDGDLVLVDAGAAWGMYCADVSRTFPVSGRFSSAQRALYEVVLAAEEAGIAAARPGRPVTDVHDAAVREITAGLLRLGLLPDQPLDDAVADGAYRRFYMHQTSHWLGLDVHDVGLYREAGEPALLQPGMVLTVEPGVYVPPDAADVPAEFRGIGIRIEDDVLMAADGPEVLTRGVPVSVEEVEALVGSAP